jgi:hypothetical protein
MSSQEQLGAARSSQEQLRSSQEQPGAARSSPGAARDSQGQPGKLKISTTHGRERRNAPQRIKSGKLVWEWRTLMMNTNTTHINGSAETSSAGSKVA